MPSSRTHRHHRKPCPRCQGAGFVDWINDVGSKIKHEFTDPNSVLRSQIVPAAAPLAKQAISSFVPGGSGVVRGLDLIGLGATQRAPMRRTRPAPAHTAERNAIVRRVMNERGVSMIEASKIVRQEGLWQRPY